MEDQEGEDRDPAHAVRPEAPAAQLETVPRRAGESPHEGGRPGRVTDVPRGRRAGAPGLSRDRTTGRVSTTGPLGEPRTTTVRSHRPSSRAGWSVRTCIPRVSRRAPAAATTLPATSSWLRRSSASCQEGVEAGGPWTPIEST